jgi:hypothetical protein
MKLTMQQWLDVLPNESFYMEKRPMLMYSTIEESSINKFVIAKIIRYSQIGFTKMVIC